MTSLLNINEDRVSCTSEDLVFDTVEVDRCRLGFGLDDGGVARRGKLRHRKNLRLLRHYPLPPTKVVFPYRSSYKVGADYLSCTDAKSRGWEMGAC